MSACPGVDIQGRVDIVKVTRQEIDAIVELDIRLRRDVDPLIAGVEVEVRDGAGCLDVKGAVTVAEVDVERVDVEVADGVGQTQAGQRRAGQQGLVGGGVTGIVYIDAVPTVLAVQYQQ